MTANAEPRPVGTPGFPPLPIFDDATAMAAIGYDPMPISIHDHWLSEDEYAALAFTHYREAIAKGLLPAYLEIESRFLDLYLALAKDGVSIVRRDGVLLPLRSDSRRYGEIVRSSLRELRFMDLYFHGHQVRAVGAFDLTPWLFLLNHSARPDVEDAVHRAGLFTLIPEPQHDAD